MALDYPTADALTDMATPRDQSHWLDTPVFRGYASPVRLEGDVHDLEVGYDPARA